MIRERSIELGDLHGIGGTDMFVLWPNVVTLISAALVGGLIGFIIYGCIKGFENTFPND